jgi:hypothetical protein
MTDSHLLNTIAYLKRRDDEDRKWMISNPPDFQGEMAQYFAEQEWEAAVSGQDDYGRDEHPMLHFLEMDAERRGLEQSSS